MLATGSSSCRLLTSVFRMRIDWPRDRAACGSFFDPNSTISTTATIRIFHGLSNRSPIMSVLLEQETSFCLSFWARVYTAAPYGGPSGCWLQVAVSHHVIRKRSRSGLVDFGNQLGRRQDPA